MKKLWKNLAFRIAVSITALGGAFGIGIFVEKKVDMNPSAVVVTTTPITGVDTLVKVPGDSIK